MAPPTPTSTHDHDCSTAIMSFSSNYLALKAASAHKQHDSPATATSNGLTSSSSRYGETFLASIGTDVVPVPIQRIASINDAAYLKNASFHSISQAAYGFLPSRPRALCQTTKTRLGS